MALLSSFESGGGDSHNKTMWCSPHLLRVKGAVLVPLSVFSLKNSTVGAFVKKKLFHTHKTGLCYLVGVSDEYPCTFYMKPHLL